MKDLIVKMTGLLFAILLISLPAFASISVGDDAIDFSLTDTKGNKFTLSEHKGKTILLFFMGFS